MFQKALRYMRCNNRKQLFYHLARNPEMLNWLDGGISLLFYTVWSQQYEIALWMLQHGADPDLMTEGGDTPLINAAANNDLKFAMLFLDFGAEIDRASSRFETPLGYACSYGAVDVVRLLCERGAFVNGTEGWGNSYLRSVTWALQGTPVDPKQVEIEQILLSHGAVIIEEEPKLQRDD